MIRRWTGPGLPLPETEAGIRIAGLLEAYGPDCPFVRFWQADEGGLVALLDGMAVAEHSMQTDREELYLFLSMQPEIRSVRTDAAFAAILAKRWGTTAKTGSVMRLERDLPPDDRVQPPASPRSVYPLLAQCFEDGLSAFDSWYVDVSHRLRHGCCHMVVLRDAQGPAATAMTVAECHGAALLGAVATRPDCRGRGYASACVSTLAHTMLAKGKAVWICPKNPAAQRLYERLHFTVCGDWGVVSKE